MQPCKEQWRDEVIGEAVAETESDNRAGRMLAFFPGTWKCNMNCEAEGHFYLTGRALETGRNSCEKQHDSADTLRRGVRR